MCHLRAQTDQALGTSGSTARIIMDQIAKSDAPKWCKKSLEIKNARNPEILR
jgi:hypothetical protein